MGRAAKEGTTRRRGRKQPENMPAEREREREEEKRDTVTPPKVTARLRGWMLAGVKRLELRHVTEDGTVRVRQWRVAEEQDGSGDTDEAADALAYEITKTAQEDAEGVGGYQKYGVYAYEHSEPGASHVARVLFEVRETNDADDDTGPTEGANAKGLTAQLMRHLESKDRMVANMFADTVGIQHQTIQALHKRLADYEETRFEQMEVAEKLISGKHARDLEDAKEARLAQIQGRIGETLALGVPVILNRLLGSGAGKPLQAKAKGEDAVKRLLMMLQSQEEKLARLMTVLAPEELAMLGELGKTFQSGGGDPILTESIIRQFLERLDGTKLSKLAAILSAEEFALLASLFTTYAPPENDEKEAAQ